MLNREQINFGSCSLDKPEVQRLDDLIINLVGLRVDLFLLPGLLVAEILIRARKDLDFVIRGYRDEIEK